jgi:four helix bundle protein
MVVEHRGTCQAEELKLRTRQLAVRIVKLYRSLPKTGEARVIGNQAVRSVTSVAADSRAACRSRSKAEFIAKIGVVVEEIDETLFWLEPLVETAIMPRERMQNLLKEVNELLAIFAAAQRTARAKGRSMNQ